MRIEETPRTDGITQLALVGRLDVSGSEAIAARFHALTAASDRPAVVDLSRLEYIASLGIGMLVSAAKALDDRGHRLALAGATGPVETALRRSGLDRALPMADDVEAAVDLLARA